MQNHPIAHEDREQARQGNQRAQERAQEQGGGAAPAQAGHRALRQRSRRHQAEEAAR